MTRVIELTVWVALLAAAPALAQSRPQTPPPPPPGVKPQTAAPTSGGATTTQAPKPQPTTAPPADPTRRTTAAPATPPATPAAPAIAPVVPAETAPTEAQLGVPVYPGATFLRSFDAGQGQRYYLFGSTAPFAEVVKYYRTQLKDGGDLVYDVPPVHMFEVGKFKEETMAFPPGVTVKDYTWGGAKGYLNAAPGANPSRFPSVIQIVPVLPANR